MHGQGRFRKVHQFHSGTGVGDAITGDMLEIRRVLRKAGYQSEIFAEHVAPGLGGEINLLNDYKGDGEALLIIHHSMGFDAFDKVVGLPDRKILRYHNITPFHFFTAPHVRHASQRGREQLYDYMRYVEVALTVSEYNRQELADLGYKYTRIMPIFFDPRPLLDTKPNRRVLKELSGTFNILCVGRICRNKRQDLILQIFERYHRLFNGNSRLFLVGSWEPEREYGEAIRETIKMLGLEGIAHLTGRVDPSQLVAYYRASHSLLSASEHEGFCVPLLEAMAFHLPVVAFKAGAVAETLGGSGVLLEERDPDLWGEVISELERNQAFRRRVIEEQARRLADFNLERSGAELVRLIDFLGRAPRRLVNMKPTVQVQGPFETSYSLAIVNRNLALALDEEGTFDVSIRCTEGPGDYTPEEKHLADKPRARWLWEKSEFLTAQPDIVIRNLYPPRVHDSPGKVNLLYFAWEDSLIPNDWVESFNCSLDAVLVPSRHVEKALRVSGVTIPIFLLCEGVEERFFSPVHGSPPPPTRKSFIFLHISSGFPRKGVDLLLKSYFLEFTAADDVRLIIKTFPNIHNTVAQQLAEWRARTPDPPECIHIDRDLTPDELDSLYQTASGLVYPTRAEGFGLPIAEAMARRIPVIVTGYSGHMDFCNEETAFLIGYRLVPSKSHCNVPGAEWAEPDGDQLRAFMRFVFEKRDTEEVKGKVEAAYQTVFRNLRWPIAAKRCGEIISRCMKRPLGTRSPLRLAMVTSWNARCGIAEYSRYLLKALVQWDADLQPVVLSSPEEGIWTQEVVPSHVCWRNRPEGDLTTLRRYVLEGEFDVVHFQFNFGFFDLKDLAETIHALKAVGKKVVMTLHRTADEQGNGQLISLGQIGEALRRADLLLVHSPIDQTRLAEFGIRENVCVFPHGNVVYPVEDPRTVREACGVPFDPLIGTFGFLLPHKGLLELLAAVKELQDDYPRLGLIGQCALHRDEISYRFEDTVRERIKKLGLSSSVLLSTQFVEPEEAVLFLQMADLLVLPYKETVESTSASVRFGLATGRPVITTNIDIFKDVAPAIYRIPSCDPREIANAIRAVLRDGVLAEKLAQQARHYTQATSWRRIAELYSDVIHSL
jgi:glycosyltransferase involved in cell wall biosynthesis